MSESLGGVLTRSSGVGRTSSARFSKRQDRRIMNNLAWKGYPEMSGMLCKIGLIRLICRALSNEVLNITKDLTDLICIPLCYHKPVSHLKTYTKFLCFDNLTVRHYGVKDQVLCAGSLARSGRALQAQSSTAFR